MGDKFRKTDLSVIEKLKSVLRNYDLKRISDEELDFLKENIHGNTEEVFYLKNILCLLIVCPFIGIVFCVKNKYLLIIESVMFIRTWT